MTDPIAKGFQDAHDVLHRNAQVFYSIKMFLNTLESSTRGLKEIQKMIDNHEKFITDTLIGGSND